MLAGNPVLNGLQAAGIGCHVAPDGCPVHGWRWHVGQRLVSQELLDVLQANPGLNGHGQAFWLVFQNLVHLDHVQGNPAVNGQVGSHQASGIAAGHQRQLVVTGVLDHLLNFFVGRWLDDQFRHGPDGLELVVVPVLSDFSHEAVRIRDHAAQVFNVASGQFIVFHTSHLTDCQNYIFQLLF